MCFRSMIVMCTSERRICKSYAWGRLAAVPHQRMTGGNDLKSRLNLTCSDAPARKTGAVFPPQRCVECRTITTDTPIGCATCACRTTLLPRTTRRWVPVHTANFEIEWSESQSRPTPRRSYRPPYLTSAPTRAWNRNRPSHRPDEVPIEVCPARLFPPALSLAEPEMDIRRECRRRQNSRGSRPSSFSSTRIPCVSSALLDRLARQPAATRKLERRPAVARLEAVPLPSDPERSSTSTSSPRRWRRCRAPPEFTRGWIMRHFQIGPEDHPRIPTAALTCSDIAMLRLICRWTPGILAKRCEIIARGSR